MLLFAHILHFCALNYLFMAINIAILASGSGSNAEKIIKHLRNKEIGTVKAVISNKKDAFALQRAANLGVKSYVFNKKEWESGKNIIHLLSELHIDFIVLAGFLLKVPKSLIDNYTNRIINIHPALLPKFGGKGMYGDFVHQAVLTSKETESGITIHYVNEEYDQGSIILQKKCPVYPNDTVSTLATRIHTLEHTYFPLVVEELISKL